MYLQARVSLSCHDGPWVLLEAIESQVLTRSREAVFSVNTF